MESLSFARLRSWPARLVPVLGLFAVALLGAGCGSDPAGPNEEPPLDISTPQGAINALEVYYSEREVDEMIDLLGAAYRFHPVDADSIPFLPSGETSWDRALEIEILREILVPERSTWLHQVLMEIGVESSTDLGNGLVEVEAVTDLTFTLSGFDLLHSSSRIVYVLEVQENGDHLLVEEREIARDPRPDMPTVSEQKARAYGEIAP